MNDIGGVIGWSNKKQRSKLRPQALAAVIDYI